MLHPDEIQHYLQAFKGLSLPDVLELLQMARTRHLPAGSIYIDEGAATQKLAYINKGLIRVYKLKENGDDITLMLRWENQFIASHDSIILNKPSRFIYQTLEDTDLMELDYAKAQPLMDNNPRLSSSRNSFLLHMLAEALERVESFVLLSPEERYLQLLHDKPDILNRVPNKYLATLLGITPVSLSRIRKRIASASKR
jgi:CRP-like cAMP-binding protein